MFSKDLTRLAGMNNDNSWLNGIGTKREKETVMGARRESLILTEGTH